MAKKAKKSARGRAQDRARVAGGQDYEVQLRGEERPEIGERREEGGQKSRQQPKESAQNVIPLAIHRAGRCLCAMVLLAKTG